MKNTGVMANKKNQRNHRNNHRRSMQRRWHASKYQKNANAQKHLMKPSSNDQLKGSRIINLDKLQEFVDQLTAHAAHCSSQIILSGEKKAGLASILSSQCSKCSFTIPLTTSRKVVGPKGKLRWEANLAAVWGQISTGGGHSKLHETMSTLGVPVMAPKKFVNTERPMQHAH